MENPILWWFVLYMVYLSAPLVPTVVIYKLFPNTSVAVSGPLQGLSLKATGAFGAYVTVAFLGYFLVSDIAEHLRRSELARWTVTGTLVLRDASGKELSGESWTEVTRSLQVSSIPPHFVIDQDTIRVETTIDIRRPPTLKYAIPQFGSADRIPSEDHAELDWRKGVMKFKKPIVIQRVRQGEERLEIPKPVTE